MLLPVSISVLLGYEGSLLGFIYYGLASIPSGLVSISVRYLSKMLLLVCIVYPLGYEGSFLGFIPYLLGFIQ
ncbi:MAG TPA: hypothetical protein DGG95_05105 [Cytophagales bacterium]|nr:hypothetical protein [Cytophagales bacterium]